MTAFTNISQIKVGMRVRCNFYGRNNYLDIHKRDGKEATIVVAPANPSSVIVVEWIDGYQGDNVWGHPSSFEPVDNLMEVHPIIHQDYAYQKVRQEKPCQVCGKPNDIGILVCWCCGNTP